MTGQALLHSAAPEGSPGPQPAGPGLSRAPSADLGLGDRTEAGPGSKGLVVSQSTVDLEAWPRKVAQGILTRV